jgi:hypothetical protein
MTREQASAVTWGLILIALGVVLLGHRLDVVPYVSLHRLWPVLLIIAGVVRLTVPADGGPRHGLGLVLVGGIFLMHTFRVMTLRDSWPLFIVAGGVSMVLEGLFRKTVRKES